MVIIFGLAALALLGVLLMVVLLPVMIVTALVRARRHKRAETDRQGSDPDSLFAELVCDQWPLEAELLRRVDPYRD